MAKRGSQIKEGVIRQIPVDLIRPISWLPERASLGDIISLAKSIKEKGDVDVPIKVRPTGQGYYERIWGKRRLEAAKMVGLRNVSCIVEEIDDREVFRQYMVENIHREEISCIEEAELFETYRRRFNVTYDEIAKMLGVDRKYVYNRVALLSLPERLKERIKQDSGRRFGLYHGLLLLKLRDKSLQEKLGLQVIEEELTTRELGKIIDDVLRQGSKSYAKGEVRQRYGGSSENHLQDEEARHSYFDLTQPLSEKTHHPLFPAPKINKSGRRIEKGLVNIQRIILPTHIGTHIDSPRQFIKGGKSLEDFPLDKFIGRGVVIHVPKGNNEPIRLGDVRSSGVRVLEGDIVFFYTGWAKRYGTSTYAQHPYISKDVAYWLVDKKAKMVGTDTPTIEIPYHMRESSFNYPLHSILLSHDILIIEGLGDMEMLANKRVFIYAVPVIMKDADSCLVRVIAKLQNTVYEQS